ncbi:MAG TPA: EAL domain-containing protein [Ilumatobacteraceae bacterium]|nr:EAL domain-containing protein [Ilumatobacteraceae bacterium]
MKTREPSARRVTVFLAIALVGASLYFTVIHGTAGQVYWDISVGAMLACGFVVASRRERHRSAWLMVLVGQACFLIGDVCFMLVENVFHSDASPNVGDIFYVAGYPFIAVGLVTLLRSRGGARDVGSVIDGFIVATSAGVLLWVFFVAPTAFDQSLPVFERLISVAYPAGDLLLIAIVAQLAVRQVRRQAPYWIVAAGLMALLVADLGYLYQSLYGSYSERDPVDFGWWISYALIVAVLLHPRVGEIAAAPLKAKPRLSPRRIVMLSLVTVAAPLTIAARSAAGATLELPALLGGTVVLFGLVVLRLVVMARELESSRGQLLHEATHDALTGLANRTLFDEQVERTLVSGVPVAVLCLDLDDFKLVNDSLGHPAGDAVLQVIGQRLLGLLRPGDAVARLGGDEFVMLVSGFDPSAGSAAAQRALSSIRQPIGLPGGQTVHTNVSVGIAHSSNESSVEALLRDADIAMYLAKRSGKGHHEVFQPGMRQDVMDRLELRAELGDALARHEFVLHYQPIVEVTSGRPVGVEALLRWEHPRRGRVEPMQFIPLAEETELIIPIGRWVLKEACRRAVELDPRPGGLEIAVNVSAVQLRDGGLVDDVLHALNSSGLDPSRLILELTESAVVSDIDAAAVTLCELRTHGVRIALDDFGAGYASLRHLRAFPVDIVKLDRSFVVSSLENDSTVLSGLISMASSLGMETVGEGIEEPGQLDVLRSLNCRYAQGFLIARPMPSDRLADVYAIGDATDEDGFEERTPVRYTEEGVVTR